MGGARIEIRSGLYQCNLSALCICIQSNQLAPFPELRSAVYAIPDIPGCVEVDQFTVTLWAVVAAILPPLFFAIHGRPAPKLYGCVWISCPRWQGREAAPFLYS
jgi:hypothetical protein